MTALFIVIAIALAAYAVFARRRHQRLKAGCLEAFASSYGAAVPKPTFEMAYSYGQPVFNIRFATAADIAAAADANAAFLRAIQAFCAGRGTRKRPFLAARAVFFTHAQDEAPPVVAYCCAQMRSQADRARGRPLISHTPETGYYGLPGRDGGGEVAIAFCPWCGSSLSAATAA